MNQKIDLNWKLDLLPQLPWIQINAERQTQQKVKIYYFALTTCAYCKKGIAWLKERKSAFNWFYFDEVFTIDERQPIKDWIKQKYDSKMSLPFVVFRFPDTDYISDGFDPDYWSSKVK